MNYVFSIKGGIGKHIAFTSFIRWVNEKYPKSKITVVSAYPEVFEHNPRIWRNLPMHQAYLFEDYIKGRDFRDGEVYQQYEVYRDKDKKHICEMWPKAYGFKGYDKDFKLEIFLTEGEKMDGMFYCEQNKPLITFQAYGGLPPGAQPNRMKVDSTGRDIPFPIALRIVQILNARGFKVLQLRGPTERPIPGTLQLQLQFRNLLPIIRSAVAHVGIDSSFMHAAAAFEKPQLIFWGQTHKDNFGYPYEGFVSQWREKGMHCRPHVGMPDNRGLYQYESENKGFEMDYTPEEIDKIVNNFIETLKPKVNKEACANNCNGGENVKTE